MFPAPAGVIPKDERKRLKAHCVDIEMSLSDYVQGLIDVDIGG